MMRKWLPVLTAAALALVGARSVVAQDTFVTIGTGGITGVYYPTGGAIAKIVNAKRKDYSIRASIESTGGSRANINAIANGSLDFGIVQSDVQYLAYNGLDAWNGKPVRKLRAVFALAPEAVTFVAAEDANIRSLTDIKGKVINLGELGSGNRINALDICKTMDLVSGKDFRDEKLKAPDAPRILQEGRIDGFFYTVGHPNESIKAALAGNRKCRIVPITGLQTLLKTSPYYAITTIDMTHYPEAVNAKDGQVETLGMLATLVTSENTPDSVVYTVTKEIMENLEQFKKLHPALNGLTQRSMLDGLTAPIHPGAMKYYKEAGFVK